MANPTPVLQVARNGGAPARGGVVGAFSDSIVFSLASTAGVRTARYYLASYPPGWACPSGWTTDTITGRYYVDVAAGAAAPAFTLPASAVWGKWSGRVELNGDGKALDTWAGVEIVSPGLGLSDLAIGEGGEYGRTGTMTIDQFRGWATSHRANLRLIDGLSPGVAGGNATSIRSVPVAVISGATQGQFLRYISGGSDFEMGFILPESSNIYRKNMAGLTGTVTIGITDPAWLATVVILYGTPAGACNLVFPTSTGAAHWVKDSTSGGLVMSHNGITIPAGVESRFIYDINLSSWVLCSSAGGVSSLNTLTGAVSIAAGTNVTLSTTGNVVTINATGGGSSPTGTGLAKVSGGAFVGAASLLVDADVSASAAITVSKLAPSGTNGQVLTTTGGVVGWAAATGGTTPTGTGLAKVSGGAFVSAAALLVDADVSASAAITPSKIAPAGTNGFVLTTTGGAVGWAAPTGGGGGSGLPIYADLATAGALPTCTYANGTAGVGATLTMNATGVLTVDGTAVALNQLVLVKNEVTGANNGLYTCTTAGAVGVAAVLTRATTADTPAKLGGISVVVVGGAANKGSVRILTLSSTAIAVGTTALTFLAPRDAAESQWTYLYDLTGLSGTITLAAGHPATYAPVVIFKGAPAAACNVVFQVPATGMVQLRIDETTGGFAHQNDSNPIVAGVQYTALYDINTSSWKLTGSPTLSGTGSVVTTGGFPSVATAAAVGQLLVQGAAGPPSFANDFGVGASNVTGTRKRFTQSVTTGGPISVSANSLGCDIVLTGTAPSNTTLTLYPGWSGKIINQAIWSTGWQTTFTNCLSYWCKVVGAVSGTVWVPPSNALPSTATNNAIGTSGNPWRLPSMVEIFDVTGTGVIVRLGDSEAFSMTFTDIGNLFNASGAIGSYGLALPAIPAGHALTFAAGVVRTAFVGGATNLSLGTQSGGTPSAVFLATSGSFVGGSVGGVYGFVLASEPGTSFLSADGYITTRLTVDTTPIVFMQQTSAASTAGGMDITMSGMRLSV